MARRCTIPCDIGGVERRIRMRAVQNTLPSQGPPYRGEQTVALNPGETAGGVVRTRIHESAPYDSQLTLSAQ